MSASGIPEQLAQLRREIDTIDRSILALLAARFEKTARVGDCKALIGESAISADRQRDRQRLLAEACREHELPADMVADIYARLSRQVVSEHVARGAAAP